MKTVQEAIAIRASKQKVFEAYVGHINRWWPRQGTYRYSFAPAGREPRHIVFERGLGGRFYEVFDDGSELVIGHITRWDPPNRLGYTWRDPSWPGQTDVSVSFIEENGVTTVTVTHSGFGAAGVPAVGAGYHTGLVEILAAFAGWVADESLLPGGPHG